MAFHVLVFFCHWAATSGMENSFNVWKKFQGAKLKRSLLCDAITNVLEMVERRILADCMLLANPKKKWFIDMRQAADFQDAIKGHKKKLSTFMMFQKERCKLQNAECCPWTTAVHVEGTFLYLLQEQKVAKEGLPAFVRVHLVNLEGFDWADSETNVPPTCLTCPTFLHGLTPCIGILTTLSNLKPLAGVGRPDSVTAWLGAKNDLCRPEIFNNRWRTDKDPTQHLSKYSYIGHHSQAPPPHEASSPSDPVLEQDLRDHVESFLSSISHLDPNQKQHALVRAKPVLNQLDAIVSKFVRDDEICKTQQVPQLFCVAFIIHVHNFSGKRFRQI
jgi:hypothetical protein